MTPAQILRISSLALAAAVAISVFGGATAVEGFSLDARSSAMGGVSVAVAEGSSCIHENAAGLAWNEGFGFSSSCLAGLDSATGALSLASGCLAAEVRIFDFGDVSRVDGEGTVLGTFTYREFLVSVGGGILAADLPPLSGLPLADSLALGALLKLLRVASLENQGFGLSIDIPFMIRIPWPAVGYPQVTAFSFGANLRNVVSLSTRFESGHKGDWTPEVVVGASIEVLGRAIVAAECSSESRFCLGLEWSPISQLSVRAGLKHLGVWIPTLGAGVSMRGRTVDLACEVHPYLGARMCGSVMLSW